MANEKLLTREQVDHIKEHPGYYADTLALEAAATIEALAADLRLALALALDGPPSCRASAGVIAARWRPTELLGADEAADAAAPLHAEALVCGDPDMVAEAPDRGEE